jgi:DNA-binding NtrC family response regulator
MSEVSVESQTVLLVEDEPVERASFSEVLKTAGYKVLEASSVRDAQQSVNASGFPQLLVTNYRKNDHNGLHLARWFIGRQPGLPVVVVTEHPEDAMANESFHPSFICWHTEWDRKTLADLIRRLVGPALF